VSEESIRRLMEGTSLWSESTGSREGVRLSEAATYSIRTGEAAKQQQFRGAADEIARAEGGASESPKESQSASGSWRSFSAPRVGFPISVTGVSALMRDLAETPSTRSYLNSTRPVFGSRLVTSRVKVGHGADPSPGAPLSKGPSDPGTRPPFGCSRASPPAFRHRGIPGAR
jgi:hypothetical protein